MKNINEMTVSERQQEAYTALELAIANLARAKVCLANLTVVGISVKDKIQEAQKHAGNALTSYHQALKAKSEPVKTLTDKLVQDV